jgi:Family of unknown function (DUF6511)
MFARNGMKKTTFDVYETDALLAGGAAAGQYLDSINQTDLAELTKDQFMLFFATYAKEYEAAMRTAMQRLKDTM